MTARTYQFPKQHVRPWAAADDLNPPVRFRDLPIEEIVREYAAHKSGRLRPVAEQPTYTYPAAGDRIEEIT